MAVRIAEGRPMEFHIAITGRTVDIERIEASVGAVDPAVVVDADATTLRVAAAVSTGELAALLRAAGLDVTPAAIQPQPSVCCGGCGG